MSGKMTHNAEKGVALKQRWRYCILLLCPFSKIAVAAECVFRHMPHIKPSKIKVHIIKVREGI